MTKTRIAPRLGALRNFALACAVSAFGMLMVAPAFATGTNVTTYHNDNYRTGWNSTETVLNPTTVLSGSGSEKFKLMKWLPLDDQVDAQPLIVTDQTIQGQGTHNVVYVATESNSIYAIDADTGHFLLKRTLAPPVTISQLPGGCNNNGNNVGIGSTPVIDAKNGTIYVMSAQNVSGTPEFRLYALDMSTLANIAWTTVKASSKLSDGSTYVFNATVSRQRSALLLANGNVYAGFASYCDSAANESRGWVLGWQTGTLTPLAHNELTNKLATDTDTFFLSSIWMSGYGLASGGPSGDIYFVTGNSDYSGTTIDGVQNIAESTVQLSSDLSKVKSIFTPSDAGSLDQGDTDFGSGGALLIPPQSGQPHDLLTAVGKDGNMYLLDADSLANKNFRTYSIGGCWCGESYYTGNDGIGRVVTSGGNNIVTFQVRQTSSPPILAREYTMANISGDQDPGFLTSVSSNGKTEGTAVIWAIGRADGSTNEYVNLYAFNAFRGAQLFTANAGTWPNTGGNANIVPTVANGKVYVASYDGLAIFGLSSAPAVTVPAAVAAEIAARAPLALNQHEIYGWVRGISGFTITVQKRDGTMVTVDAKPAAKDGDLAAPSVGHGILVRGTISPSGEVVASVILHAKDHATMWLPDR